MSTVIVPRAFVWRRLHSLTGLWFVLFLIEHLLTNSQAALWLGDNGQGFVNMVNFIHNLPYLEAIEIFLLGVPILVHMIWGVKYLLTAKYNSFKTDGSKPSLREYSRNHAYTWQRITSWILLIGIILHVTKFRFLEYPDHFGQGKDSIYFVRLDVDDGLYTVADRLGVALYDNETIAKEKEDLSNRSSDEALLQAAKMLKEQNKGAESTAFDMQKAIILPAAERFKEKKEWVETLEKISLKETQVIAATRNFGTASLLTVRDTFKSPIYIGLYTIFVLAACFHAFNGLWTFLITWGAIFKYAAQKSMVTFTVVIMIIIAFLGLASIWGTYWLNLRS